MAQTSSNKCDICEEAISKVFCYACHHFLCQTCQAWHEKFPSNKRHRIVDSSHIDRSAFTTKLVCEKHNQEYAHYCQNCTCLTCAICVTADHRSHSFTNVSEITSSLRQDVKKTVDDVMTKLKQITGLIDDIRSVQLQQIEHDKEKFTSEVRFLSEDIHNIVNFVTDLHITRANDFLVLQQQNLKHDLAKSEKVYKEYSSVATKCERSLHEAHDMTFFVQHKSLKKDYDDLDDIPTPEVPQRLEEFKQEEFTTLVIDKMKEKHDLSLIRSLKEKDEEILHLNSQLKDEREKTKTMTRSLKEKDEEILHLNSQMTDIWEMANTMKMSDDDEIKELREKLERTKSENRLRSSSRPFWLFQRKSDVDGFGSLKEKNEEIRHLNLQLKDERKKTETLIMFKDLEIWNLREKLKRQELIASNRKIQVFVKTILQGGKMLVISLHTKDTIQNLKQLIQEKEGIPLDQQLLYIFGTGKRLLKEELTVDDFGIQNGTMLELKPKIKVQDKPNDILIYPALDQLEQ